MRASLSTSVRAVNQITPYLGCDETRSSTATAARPLSRPWSQLSYCGWKTENVLSPLASCRGHGSTSTSVAAGEVFAGMRTSDRPDPFAFLLKQDDPRSVHPTVVLRTARGDNNMMIEP